MLVHILLRVLQIHTSKGTWFSFRQNLTHDLHTGILWNTELFKVRLRTSISIPEKLDYIVWPPQQHHQTSDSLYLLLLSECSRQDMDDLQDAMLQQVWPVHHYQQILQHWEMIIRYFTCSNTTTQKKKINYNLNQIFFNLLLF